VLRGWLAYYAVPMSAPAITAFRHHLVDRWLHAIRRRGQKHRLKRPSRIAGQSGHIRRALEQALG
jgi:RNA-directed DNA polymerase